MLTPFLLFDKLKDGTNNTRLQDLRDVPCSWYGVQWIFRGIAR
jgi:hypothetical protein